jgi:hypothetical protein
MKAVIDQQMMMGRDEDMGRFVTYIQHAIDAGIFNL